MIDLRSDTVTKPTTQMREAMLAAPVGDDVYAEDPTVIELERRVARLLGHEAGLFCVSGSMCNMLGVRLLVEPGQEVVCDVQAHIARAEMGAHAAMHGLTMRTFPSTRGRVQFAEVAKIISPSAGPYLVSTAAVAVENTHNFGGGTIQQFDELAAVGELCREHNVGYHLDGARLWNAHVATGVGLDAAPKTSRVPECSGSDLAGGGARPACSPLPACTPLIIMCSGWPMIMQRHGSSPKLWPATSPLQSSWIPSRRMLW